MLVRQAAARDTEAIAPLLDAYRQFYGQPADPARSRTFLAERLARHESIVFVACDACEVPTGFTQLYPLFSTVRTARTYLLNDLFVAPAARRRGVGRALIGAAVEFARANGAAALSLQTAIDNREARSLYAAAGWDHDVRFCEYTFALGERA
jgi:GNAT superfamily N-acetyltransferase